MKLHVHDTEAGVAFDAQCRVSGIGGNADGVTIECRDVSRLVAVTLTHAEFYTLYVQYRDNWLRKREREEVRPN